MKNLIIYMIIDLMPSIFYNENKRCKNKHNDEKFLILFFNFSINNKKWKKIHPEHLNINIKWII